MTDKPVARHGKRDAPASAPSEARGGGAGGERGGRAGRARGRGGFSGNDGGKTFPFYKLELHGEWASFIRRLLFYTQY